MTKPVAPTDFVGLQSVRVGEDASAPLDAMPANFRVAIVTHRLSFAYRLADREVRIA